MSDLREKPTYLYRHFCSEGTLLYVGISLNHMARLAQHKDGSPWFDAIAQVHIEKYESRTEAMQAEREAILNESPRFNVNVPGGARPREQLRQSVEQSAAEIGARVHFQPIYTVPQLSQVLSIPQRALENEIAEGRLRAFEQPRLWWTANQKRAKTLITGWAAVDWLEFMDSGPE